MGKDFIALNVRETFERQAAHCTRLNAVVTAGVVTAILNGMSGTGKFRERLRNWPESSGADALALRAAAGVRALFLDGTAPELAPIYALGPDRPDQASLDQMVNAVIDAHDDALLPWLDGPPQTNEAGRSANYIAALLWLQEHGLPAQWECLEIGSSAGINLMMDRYGFDLGGVKAGVADSAMQIVPDWRGAPLGMTPGNNWAIASIRGCDVAPIDLNDPEAVFRLRTYIWPEHTERFARFEQAVAMARQQAPDLVEQDAVDFVTDALARPQVAGQTRVLMHTVVWQYLGPERQAQITAAMEAAGAAATAERPLAWVWVEINPTLWRHELCVRYWPGDGQTHLLAVAHPHGEWINWQGGE